MTRPDKIKDILATQLHRPYAMPAGPWAYYQEWNRALFLHWKIPVEILHKAMPRKLHLDLYEGEAWISLVAFTMEQIRPRFLPAVGFISNFDEINLRTYVVEDGKPGVYFISMEAGKHLSAWVAKTLSGLPYEKAEMLRPDAVNRSIYRSRNTKKGFHLNAVYETGDMMREKSALDKWLTERYCLYMDKQDAFFRYDIHHKEWEVQTVALKQIDLEYRIDTFSVTGMPHLAHYSKGVQVLAWKRQPVK